MKQIIVNKQSKQKDLKHKKKEKEKENFRLMSQRKALQALFFDHSPPSNLFTN